MSMSIEPTSQTKKKMKNHIFRLWKKKRRNTKTIQ